MIALFADSRLVDFSLNSRSAIQFRRGEVLNAAVMQVEQLCGLHFGTKDTEKETVHVSKILYDETDAQ
jgi:hypothetical protein